MGKAKKKAGGLDVFVSYADRDRPWAEWIAWHLRQSGLAVEIGGPDWQAGDNAVLRRTDAIERAERVVAVYSDAYFDREAAGDNDWTVLAAHGVRLVPLRVEEVHPPAVLRPYVACDLFGLDEEPARLRLLEACGVAVHADGRPVFPPGRTRKKVTGPEPRLPGSLPDVWQAPPRNAMFKGREKDLAELRERLSAQASGSVQSIHGMGGIGKSTLALEYAHRFAGSYGLVWWIDAEQPGLIGEQIAALGIEAGWCTADVSDSRATTMVRHRLRTEGGWLVIFDNAERPDDLRRWLPQGAGHVLITSRNSGWAGIAKPSELDIFDRDNSVDLLRELVPAIAAGEADDLADDLGDLPLAVAQAGALLAESGMPVETYRRLLATEAAELLSLGDANGYLASLAAVVRISLERIATEDAAAANIARVCALLSAEPIPIDIFTGAPPRLREGFAGGGVPAESAVHASIGRIGRYGLAKLAGGLIRMHRLTQAIIRDLMAAGDRASTRLQAQELVAAAHPLDSAGVADGGRDPEAWPRWAQLLPHLLELEPATSGFEPLRETALDAARYLLSRGDYGAMTALATQLYEGWRRSLGADAKQTLSAGRLIITGRTRMGEAPRAQDLAAEIYASCEKVFGSSHPDTLNSGQALSGLLYSMGQVDEAERVAADCLGRARSALGEDHEFTTLLKSSVANVLWHRGEHNEALTLEEEALDWLSRVRGPDDLDTLIGAHNFVETLFSLGHDDRAIRLLEDTFERSRRRFGADHPLTLWHARRLGEMLAATKRASDARELLRDTLDRSVRVAGPSSVLALEARVAVIQFQARFGPRGPLGGMVDELVRCIQASYAFETWDLPSREMIDKMADLLRQMSRPAQAKSLAAGLEKVIRAAENDAGFGPRPTAP
ncbi:FxSxx-COOH system tetratricopeptide repeat protein [Asanoa sp. NPDC049573]|uniref:FxSxx-COOH system tetratricopeptide repeat protein n=1 Tax=Asanoa sp. NPDC049573 TaxID=3155396 RepID=UPI00342C0B70